MNFPRPRLYAHLRKPLSPNPSIHLSLRNRSPQLNTPLPRIQPLLLQLNRLRTLLYDFFAFGEDEFDVAWV